MHDISDEEKAKLNEALSQDESTKGSLNNPVGNEVLKLKGKIKDGSEFGKHIIVVEEVSRNTGKPYYSVYEKKGILFPATEVNGEKPKYAFSGSFDMDGNMKKMYAYDNGEYYGLVLHDKDNNEENIL